MDWTSASKRFNKQRSLRSENSATQSDQNVSDARKTDSQSSSESTLTDSINSESIARTKCLYLPDSLAMGV